MLIIPLTVFTQLKELHSSQARTRGGEGGGLGKPPIFQ